jgi:hypothetical protein
MREETVRQSDYGDVILGHVWVISPSFGVIRGAAGGKRETVLGTVSETV